VTPFFLRHLRWPWLIFTLPPCLLWARSFPYAGLPLVIFHCTTTLLHGVLHDLDAQRRRAEPRLLVLGPRLRLEPAHLAPRAGFLLALSAGAVGLLVVTDYQIAVVAAAALLLLLAGHRVKHRLGRWRARLTEVLLPVFALVLPVLALAFVAERNELAAMAARAVPGTEGEPQQLPELISAARQTATILWGVVMGVFILMCETRDAPFDRTERLLTTPTVLGERPAGAAVVLWTALAMLVSAYGTGHRMWGWLVAGFIGVGAMLAANLLGASRPRYAALAWTVASAAAGVALVGRL